MKLTLTDQERIDLLEEAKNHLVTGICNALKLAYIELDHSTYEASIIYNNVTTYFPELNKYKPKGKVSGEYWWGDEEKNTERRRDVINKTIQDIKVKQNG